MNPEIRYAKSGDVHIAYQVFGNGPQNLVIIPGFISHVEHVWDSPDQAAWFNHLARRTRVVMFDKRGTGLTSAPRILARQKHKKGTRAVMVPQRGITVREARRVAAYRS